jgi:hypothetical protein
MRFSRDTLAGCRADSFEKTWGDRESSSRWFCRLRRDGPVSCFMDDQELEGGDVLCSEGTRHCRGGVWSSCEDVHQYVASPSRDTQRVLDPMAACNVCDKKCFQIVDHLLADGGVAGGNVTFGPGGGITLLPGDDGAAGPGMDAGGSTTHAPMPAGRGSRKYQSSGMYEHPTARALMQSSALKLSR